VIQGEAVKRIDLVGGCAISLLPTKRNPMELTGQQLIPAPQSVTWAALNDPQMLKECIAGCESIETTGENQFLAKMAVRIGPVNAKFTGKLQLTEIDEPNAYTLNFDGQGGIAGFGKGSARVQLTPQDGATLLDYTAKAQIGGKLAQIGSRLVDSAAKKMADDFFGEFNQKVGALHAADTPAPHEPVTVSPARSSAPSSTDQSTSTSNGWLWPAVALFVGIAIGWLIK
jgi:uncharacterized protein